MLQTLARTAIMRIATKPGRRQLLEDKSVASVVMQVSWSWWVLLLQGVLGILFGLVAFAWPGPTLAVMIGLFGIYMLLIGVVGTVVAIGAAGSGEPWGWRLAAALLSVLTGLLILRWPGV